MVKTNWLLQPFSTFVTFPAKLYSINAEKPVQLFVLLGQLTVSSSVIFNLNIIQCKLFVYLLRTIRVENTHKPQ